MYNFKCNSQSTIYNTFFSYYHHRKGAYTPFMGVNNMFSAQTIACQCRFHNYLINTKNATARGIYYHSLGTIYSICTKHRYVKI